MSQVAEKRNLALEVHTAFLQQEWASDPIRQKAIEEFLKNDFPGPKTEEYKFTPITRILNKTFDPSQRLIQATAPLLPLIDGFSANIVAFVNGRYSEKHSVILDKSLQIQTLQTSPVQGSEDPFDLLNLAFHPQLVDIEVESNTSLRSPIVICYHFDAAEFVFANPRWRLTLAKDASATLVEYTSCPASTNYFNNKQSNVEVNENGQLEYIVIQNGPQSDLQVANTHVRLLSKARASFFTMTFDGLLVRNNLTLSLDGEGIDARLHGLYLLAKNFIADNHTVVDHRQPNSYSNEIYKGVMDENSKGVFNGKIYVRPDAQKTNAFQSNRNILLSESAVVNTKPQLEIWADDVKCSHGCTTGQLDEEAMFYLRSRGISRDMARGMMLYAFAAETFAPLKNEPVRNLIDSLVSKKLHKTF